VDGDVCWQNISEVDKWDLLNPQPTAAYKPIGTTPTVAIPTSNTNWNAEKEAALKIINEKISTINQTIGGGRQI
jgi:hypothetical protein